MAVLTPVVGRWVAVPGYQWFVRKSRFAGRGGLWLNMLLMAGVLGGFLAIAAYAGASVLFGAFLAGAFVSGLPGNTAEKVPVFTESFDLYLGGPQKYVFQPLFFASIGFAIPFLELWTGEVIWKGVVYTLLMAFGKLVVGVTVSDWDLISSRRQQTSKKAPNGAMPPNWEPASLLGAAMVARGEIGLLIIQIGLNETPFLTRKAFVIGIWAIVLNTIIGPVLVGILLKRVGPNIAKHTRWGVQARHDSDLEVATAERKEGQEGPSLRPVLG
jgi:Kef-type K+ transport system membrane component KefB